MPPKADKGLPGSAGACGGSGGEIAICSTGERILPAGSRTSHMTPRVEPKNWETATGPPSLNNVSFTVVEDRIVAEGEVRTARKRGGFAASHRPIPNPTDGAAGAGE